MFHSSINAGALRAVVVLAGPEQDSGQFSPIMYTTQALLCPVLYITQRVAKLWYKSSAVTGQSSGDQFTQGGAKGILAFCFLQYFSDVAFAFATCEMATLDKGPPLPQSCCNS